MYTVNLVVPVNWSFKYHYVEVSVYVVEMRVHRKPAWTRQPTIDL